MAKCRICGAAHRACGSSTATPIDHNVSEHQGGTMALKEYEVTVAGRHPHKTTMLLNEAEAKRLNAVEVKVAKTAAKKKAQPAPRNKVVKPAADKAAPAPAPTPTPAAPAGGVEDASDPSASE